MENLFANTGMAITTTIVIVAELLSLLLMAVILLAFRRVERKQSELFLTLHDAPPTFSRHSVLVWLYILTTLGIGLVSALLFTAQPHIL